MNENEPEYITEVKYTLVEKLIIIQSVCASLILLTLLICSKNQMYSFLEVDEIGNHEYEIWKVIGVYCGVAFVSLTIGAHIALFYRSVNRTWYNIFVFACIIPIFAGILIASPILAMICYFLAYAVGVCLYFIFGIPISILGSIFH